jgi:hypothetical protein
MMNEGTLKVALIEGLDGFRTPDECYAKLKKVEHQLKARQEQALRRAGDMESTLELEFNDSQRSVTACANDRLNGFQLIHICSVEPYDINRPNVRINDGDDWT